MNREGALADVPFPMLLAALLAEERTCTLELRLRNLEKRIAIEEGVPVACDSNLLHETLGRYLVERGKLPEAEYQKALAESVVGGKQLGGLLVEKGLISAFELYKQLQANLAHRILDCFHWTGARYRLSDFEAPQTPIRMNSRRLVFTGSINVLPLEVVSAHLPAGHRFALTARAKELLQDLKLSGKDARFVQLLKDGPTAEQLAEKTGHTAEAAQRRLFALRVLGAIELTEGVAPVAAPPPAPPPPAHEEEPAEPAVDVKARDALAAAFLDHRGKDPFDLLGVPVDAPMASLRRAFLAKAEAFPPGSFAAPELKEKAETLLCAYARAFAALADPESNALHRRRRAVAAEAKHAPRGPGAAEQFRIRTDLLDAGTQFAEGQKRLAAGQFKAAIEFFEYACDIEPRGKHRAFLSYARFKLFPTLGGERALRELAEACEAEPACAPAWAFRGEVAKALSQFTLAEECYRRAVKADPSERRYTEAMRDLMRDAVRARSG